MCKKSKIKLFYKILEFWHKFLLWKLKLFDFIAFWTENLNTVLTWEIRNSKSIMVAELSGIISVLWKCAEN